jgi:uridylate kinase
MTQDENVFVLSLGGSLIVPNGGIDTEFLTKFHEFIRRQVSEKNRRFFITVGGGAITRDYQKAARIVRKHDLSDTDADWLGVHATRLNAQLMRAIFQDLADPRVIKHYEIILKIQSPVAIAAGWKPGWSTDYCAVTLCQDYGLRQVVNMTNVDQVYDKDPNKFPDAKALTHISWREYRKMVGDEWKPGMNAPFDPIASKLAADLGITVKIVNGKNLTNLELALSGKPFVGTTIQ